MLVNRFTRIVKKGCMEEAVALVKAEMERSSPPHASRIYTPHTAPIDVIAIEFEFEDLGELGQFWDPWFADPETAAFNEKFDQVTKPGGANEIWNLAE